jgi:hypothetical protein
MPRAGSLYHLLHGACHQLAANMQPRTCASACHRCLFCVPPGTSHNATRTSSPSGPTFTVSSWILLIDGPCRAAEGNAAAAVAAAQPLQKQPLLSIIAWMQQRQSLGVGKTSRSANGSPHNGGSHRGRSQRHMWRQPSPSAPKSDCWLVVAWHNRLISQRHAHQRLAAFAGTQHCDLQVHRCCSRG